jgi:hypothetical protein
MSQRRSLYLSDDDGTAVLADYYDGAYGKTLRIDIQSDRSLLTFVESIGELCTCDKKEISFKSRDRMVLVPPLQDVRFSVAKIEDISSAKSEHGLVIEWSNPPTGWEEVVELLRPLLESDYQSTGRHQYLTPPTAHILVELSFRE